METISNADMTNASGVQNLVKNIGAAVGTSLVATMISRYSQVFQHNMVEYLNPLNPIYSDRLNELTMLFAQMEEFTFAQMKAQGMLYQQLVQQSTLWAYIHSFRVFGVVCFLCLPLLLCYGRRKTAERTQKAQEI